MLTANQNEVKDNWVRAEESKVKPKTFPLRPSPALKKERTPGGAFLVSRFQRTSSSSCRRRPAASLVLEFHRREWNLGSPTGAAPRG